MASKFAGLPGIAHGEVDVYETTGSAVNGDRLPDVVYDVSENDNIERLRINPGESYAQFKGKTVSGDAVDFSNSISKSKNTGYKSSPLTDFESAGGGLADETLQDRYERLQAGIRSLEADFRFLATQQQREDTFVQQTATDFSGKMDELKSHLAVLTAGLATIPARVSKPLQLSAEGAGDHPRKLAADSDDLDPTRTVILEQRLRKLEQAFGTDKDLITLAGDSSSSLMATVTMLKNQMSLLDKDNLDHIESRMQTFLPKLNQALDRKSHATEPELDKKITEAYALLKGWEETINTLPAVVDRLVALKAVHEQASAYVQLQQEVDELQQQLAVKISVMEGNVKLSEESFSQSLALIRKNMDHLELRCKGAKQ